MSTTPFTPTVLIVDDESLFRNSVVDALMDACPTFRVLEASDGREALDHVGDEEVDVVVTDISMPVMDGLELMLNLRNRGFAGAVIVVTAFGDPMLRSEVAIHGGFGYLEKPIDLPELIEAVQDAAIGKRHAVQGLKLSSFVRLLELERKSCCLRVYRDNRQGDLLFQDGILVDARLGDEKGNEAAFELLSWQDDVRLELYPDCRALDEMNAKDRGGGSADVVSADDPSDRHNEEGGNALAMHENREIDMGNVTASLNTIMEIDGAIGVALVDHESGMSLGQQGGGDRLNLDVAGAGNTAVVRAKMRVMKDLGLKDGIEDILITLDSQYHLIRPLSEAPNLFLYLALDREKSNLAMARHKLMAIEKTLEV